MDGVDTFARVPMGLVGEVWMESEPRAVGLRETFVCRDGLGMPRRRLVCLTADVGLGLRLP